MGLNTGSISALSQQFSGEIVTASDEGYDLARRVWNAMIDQRPRLVARPRNASDVAAAGSFAPIAAASPFSTRRSSSS